MPILVLNLKNSFSLGVSLLAIHAYALFCIVLYQCELLFQLSLAVLVIAHGFYTCFYYAYLKSVRSVLSVELNVRDEWCLRERGNYYFAQLLSSSLVTQYLIVLNFKSHHFLNTHVILMRDSLSAEQWRQLRVYLTTHHRNGV